MFLPSSLGARQLLEGSLMESTDFHFAGVTKRAAKDADEAKRRLEAAGYTVTKNTGTVSGLPTFSIRVARGYVHLSFNRDGRPGMLTRYMGNSVTEEETKAISRILGFKGCVCETDDELYNEYWLSTDDPASVAEVEEVDLAEAARLIQAAKLAMRRAGLADDPVSPPAKLGGITEAGAR